MNPAERLAALGSAMNPDGSIPASVAPGTGGGGGGPHATSHGSGQGDAVTPAAIGAAVAHAHPYASDTHLHGGVYEPVHSHPYAATGHTHPGGGPTIVKLTSNQVSAVTTFADITGFTKALAANEYCAFEAVLVYRANATTTGIRLGVNGPASPTVLAYRVSSSRTNAAASAAGATDNEATFVAQTYDSPAADSGVAAAATDYLATIKGVIANGANAGTLAMRFASEVAVANGITLRPGSHVMFWSI